MAPQVAREAESFPKFGSSPGSTLFPSYPPSSPFGMLQQQAASIVAKGQIVPILQASPLHRSLIGGETAIKDVLMRELNIGSSSSGGFSSIPGPAFNVIPQGGGQNFGGFNQQSVGSGNFGGNNFGGVGSNRRQNWDRGGRNNRM